MLKTRTTTFKSWIHLVLLALIDLSLPWISNLSTQLSLKTKDLHPNQEPSTDTLARLAELVLNFNSSEFNNSYYQHIGGVRKWVRKWGPVTPVSMFMTSQIECFKTSTETVLKCTNNILTTSSTPHLVPAKISKRF